MAGAVKALGEVALRVNDLDTVQAFYSEVIGLELMRRFESAAFFRVSRGYDGHTAILALFDRQTPVDRERSTIDHIAFTISGDDFEFEKKRLEILGLKVTVTYHDWVQWKSLYLHDPEGNVVELVCYDPEGL